MSREEQAQRIRELEGNVERLARALALMSQARERLAHAEKLQRELAGSSRGRSWR